MNIDAAVGRACERVPGMLRGALVLLPEGFLLGATPGAHVLDLEPMIRSAARCLTAPTLPALRGRDGAFTELVFVFHDHLFVIQVSRRDPRLALVIACTREHNLAFVLGATRLVIGSVEEELDLGAWGL
ncbi:MAG: hypothetical protein KF773_03365 [Deltaproteobacteria bacterium]|nr:hypothetical protein [Deltaproteobacteria bacterium]MCW5802897.1 hypothetical protein [Deltaproteobacteria bacterium]